MTLSQSRHSNDFKNKCCQIANCSRNIMVQCSHLLTNGPVLYVNINANENATAIYFWLPLSLYTHIHISYSHFVPVDPCKCHTVGLWIRALFLKRHLNILIWRTEDHFKTLRVRAKFKCCICLSSPSFTFVHFITGKKVFFFFKAYTEITQPFPTFCGVPGRLLSKPHLYPWIWGARYDKGRRKQFPSLLLALSLNLFQPCP